MSTDRLTCTAGTWPAEQALHADWDAPPWSRLEAHRLTHHMGERPAHFPCVEFKLAHDREAIWLAFRVDDRYVCARAGRNQGPVWQDSCVEFFFTPGPDPSRQGYFNLEINCLGVLLLHHQKARGVEQTVVADADLARVQVVHTLVGPLVEEEPGPLVWAVACRLPLAVLRDYAAVDEPGAGLPWRANAYKCADGSSHPHWLTWSPVQAPRPDFHLPSFFGLVDFE